MPHMRPLSLSIASIVLFFASGVLRAEVKVPPLFDDHCVLQRDMKVPVWGTADPNEKVTVALNGKQASATADASGKWQAELPAMPAGGPFVLEIAGASGEPLRFENAMLGDVWLCSGQSNMDWPVNKSKEPEKEIAGATDAMIRLYQFPHTSKVEPSKEVLGEWKPTSPETIPNFSAVGYFFARELRRVRPDVAVGLIQCAWGGMPAESFMSREMLETRPEFKPILERKADVIAANQAAASTQATDPAQKPPAPDAPHLASNVFNGQILPLVPFAVKGAIWYQGESNAGRAVQYRTLFPAMIEDWRKQWGKSAEEFPFLFVQLANFKEAKPQPGDSDWAELREAQLMTLDASPNTGMAVIIDIGEAKDIHPKNKQDVGKRLALAAEHLAYDNESIVYSGPIYRSMTVDGDKIRLKFDHIGSGLQARGGGELKGFAIAGEDQQFVWAEAKIDGDAVVVWSDQVKCPRSVRYAWADNPDGANLYNKEGLPASPFRTDDWKLTTEGAN